MVLSTTTTTTIITTRFPFVVETVSPSLVVSGLCLFFVNCTRLPCQKISKVLFSWVTQGLILYESCSRMSLECYNGDGKNK